jgi:hypothetical protein
LVDNRLALLVHLLLLVDNRAALLLFLLLPFVEDFVVLLIILEESITLARANDDMRVERVVNDILKRIRRGVDETNKYRSLFIEYLNLVSPI